MKLSNRCHMEAGMLKQMTSAAALCGSLLAGPALAIDGDPCSDISCDGDDCLTCWEEGDTVICEEVPKFELELICDIDLLPQGLRLTAPQGARGPALLNVDRGQILPQSLVPQPELGPTFPQ
jgi:hypothetical protein